MCAACLDRSDLMIISERGGGVKRWKESPQNSIYSRPGPEA